MRFTQESGGPAHLIRAYSATEVHIGERVITGSCLVSAQTLRTDALPASFAEFNAAALEPILALEPEVLILGTGPEHRFAPLEVRHALAARRIGVEAMQLGAACRTFNVLLQEERRVVAALFLR